MARSAAVLAVLGCSFAAASAMAVRINPARTWVGIARVHLTVQDVRLTGTALEASYAIRIPLWPSGDDTGTLHLRAGQPIDDLNRSGGRLVGTAHSASGVTRPVSCEVQPGGKLRIDIAMDERTVSFETRFELADPGNRSQTATDLSR